MCIFCDIVKGQEEASIIYEDDDVMAFMNIRPIHEGEFMVIPKQHIDHFTDLSDELASKIMVIAQKFGRRLMQIVKPLRIGYVVHGFGVPHAHLNVVPMFHSNDIISSKHVSIEDSKVVISDQDVPFYLRQDLDAMAARLRQV